MARQTNTVASVAEEMLVLAERQIKSAHTIRFVLTKHVLPRLGERPIEEVTLLEINRLLDSFVAQERVGTAREVRKHMSRLMKYAHQRGMVPQNVMLSLDRRDLAQEPDERFIEDDELVEIWQQAKTLEYPWGPCIIMAMLTGARPAEVHKVPWSEIDLDKRVWAVDKERRKSGGSYIVPLSEPLVKALEALPHRDGFVFSADGGRTPLYDGKGVNKRLPGDITMKAFRKTVRTTLPRLGVPQDICGRCLGHSVQGIERFYNMWDYAEAKRDAFDKFAAHVMGLVNEQ